MRSFATVIFALVSLLLLAQQPHHATAFVNPSSLSRLPTMTSTSRRSTAMPPLYAESAAVQEQETVFWQRSEEAPSTPPEIVYILLYNPGTAEEGVYTTTLVDDGTTEILWVFVELTDALEFADLLKANEPPPKFNLALYPEPIPTPAPLAQMETAAVDMNLVLRVVPAS